MFDYTFGFKQKRMALLLQTLSNLRLFFVSSVFGFDLFKDGLGPA